MKRSTFLGTVARFSLVCIAVMALATPAEAQDKRFINIALVTPIQIFPETQPISGIRWNILYGSTVSMSGFDFGLANHVKGPMTGVQWGLANLTESMNGWQYGFVNYTERECEGFQWGGVNVAGRINGLQLAVVNYAERANGVQVGLVNIIKEGGMFPVMVIANWGFDQARN